jgi:hypothetical protein
MKALIYLNSRTHIFNTVDVHDLTNFSPYMTILLAYFLPHDSVRPSPALSLPLFKSLYPRIRLAPSPARQPDKIASTFLGHLN